MISYKLLKENGLKPKKISKLGNKTFLLETNNHKYVIKEETKYIDEKYNYLLSRGYNYFPKNYRLGKYLVYEYIENINMSKEEKVYEIMNLISLLHTKTTVYKNISIDDYKIIYEDLDKRINDTNDYYNKLNNLIDEEIYMSPSKYLLAKNISKIYSALYFCKEELNNWYELVKNTTKQRVVFIHNNLKEDYLLKRNSSYLIGWDNSKQDIPIYDIYDLYNKYGCDVSFDLALKNYQKKYALTEEELKLLFIYISIPEKIYFDSNEIENTLKVKKIITRLEKSDQLIKSYYKKD